MKLIVASSQPIKVGYYGCGSHKVEVEFDLDEVDIESLFVRIINNDPEIIGRVHSTLRKELETLKLLVEDKKAFIDKNKDWLPPEVVIPSD